MTSSREPTSDELISAYLDGELSGQQRAHVEQLILREPRYRQQLESLRALRDSLQQLPRHNADDRFAERVLRRINEQRPLRESDSTAVHLSPNLQLEQRDRSTRRGLRRGLLWSLATTAAAVLIAVAMPSRDPAPQIGQVPAPTARAMAEKDVDVERSRRSEADDKSKSADKPDDRANRTPVHNNGQLRQLRRGATNAAPDSSTSDAIGLQMHTEGEQVLTLVEAEVDTKQLRELLVQIQQLPANVIEPPAAGAVDEIADRRSHDVETKKRNEYGLAPGRTLIESKVDPSSASLKDSSEANAETWLLVEAPLETVTQVLQQAEAQITLTEAHQGTVESVQRDAAQRRPLQANYKFVDGFRKAVPQQPESGERSGQETAAGAPPPPLDAADRLRIDRDEAAPSPAQSAGPVPSAPADGNITEALQERSAGISNQPSEEQRRGPNHRVLLLLRLGSKGSVNSATTPRPAKDSAD